MPKMHVIPPNSDVTTTEITKIPPLKDLQKIVGGYIERLHVFFNGKICDMIVNEEGNLNDLPFNSRASFHYLLFCSRIYKYKNLPTETSSSIVGTAIIFEGINL